MNEYTPARSPERPVAQSPLQRRVLPLLSLVLFVFAALAIDRTLEGTSYAELAGAFEALSGRQIALGLLFTLGSYVVLTGYDWSALLYLRRRVPYRTVALATFCGVAIANTLGFNIVSGGSVRYRIYVLAGLNAFDVAGITVFGMIAFGIGVSIVTATAVVIYPDAVAAVIGISPPWLTSLGALALSVLAALLVLSFLRRTPIRIGRWQVRIPTGQIALGQLFVTLVDMVLAGSCLYVLMDAPRVPFLGFLAVYVVGVQAGMMSHVPGGLGIFESIMLLTFQSEIPVAALTAALLAYRAIYYLVPLVLASIVLLGREVQEWLSRSARP